MIPIITAGGKTTRATRGERKAPVATTTPNHSTAPSRPFVYKRAALPYFANSMSPSSQPAHTPTKQSSKPTLHFHTGFPTRFSGTNPTTNKMPSSTQNAQPENPQQSGCSVMSKPQDPKQSGCTVMAKPQNPQQSGCSVM